MRVKDLFKEQSPNGSSDGSLHDQGQGFSLTLTILTAHHVTAFQVKLLKRKLLTSVSDKTMPAGFGEIKPINQSVLNAVCLEFRKARDSMRSLGKETLQMITKKIFTSASNVASAGTDPGQVLCEIV